jgi:ActR/RegA family two-component response regulator
MDRIILVGHCGPDASYLVLTAKKAAPAAEVMRADSAASLADAVLNNGGATLLLVNRVLDGDFTDDGGIELIARIRAAHPNVRALLVSNYPEAQHAAVRAGALPGFGKREIGSAKVLDLIRGGLK